MAWENIWERDGERDYGEMLPAASVWAWGLVILWCACVRCLAFMFHRATTFFWLGNWGGICFVGSVPYLRGRYVLLDWCFRSEDGDFVGSGGMLGSTYVIFCEGCVYIMVSGGFQRLFFN